MLEPKKEPEKRPVDVVHTPRAKADNVSLETLDKLLSIFHPDCDYDKWTRIGMGIFHETHGSDEGLAMYDRWSSKGKKYPGSKDVETKWRSFRNVPNPVTIGTLIMMARDAGADVASIMGDKFEPFEDEEVNPIVEVTPQTDCPLARFSLQGYVDELEKQAVEQTLILGNIALLGQATVIYAKPNTGKTLIILFLIIEAIKNGKLDPSSCFT